MTKSDYVLFLPKWYPNDEDPQLGVFIQKQAQAVAQLKRVVVLYVQKKDQLSEKFLFHRRDHENWTELTVQFQGANTKVTNLKRYRLAQKKGLEKIGRLPEICHVHVPVRSSFLAQRLWRKYQIPFVVSEHWSGFINGEFEKRGNLYQWMYKRVLSKAQKAIVVSQPLKEAFVKNKLPKPIIVPNIIDKVENNTVKENIILTVGDLVDLTKNISGIINAFDAWKQNTKSDFQLHIIGGGPDEKKLKHLAQSKSYADLIHFHGRLTNDKVLHWMQKAKMYVCNSNFETFGVTVGEALSANTPVICTRCQGPEQFITENNGILIEKQDEQALQKALENLTGSLNNYQNVAKSVTTKYSAKHIANQLQSIYKKWS